MSNETSQVNVRFLFITANTGSIFEKPELLTAWLIEFANLLRRHPSDFIALHCQETGGKDYEKYMHTLDQFIEDLLHIPELSSDFTRHRLYFDSDYSTQETFTALGCAYFIRRNLAVQQWNFTTSSFQPVANRQIFAGNLVNAQTVRREKYPREFFPEAKWSRKGFTQTRWLINGFIFDLLNVHLFHDASNILAVERSPSIYSKCRRNALKFTLESLPLDSSGKHVPYVIFGDFNFRLDAHQLVKHISEKRHNLIDKIKVDNSDEIAKIVIRDEDNKPKLTIEKKEFNLHDDHDSFFNTNTQQANLFDFESSSFNDHIFEYEKTFPPSYPYSEDHLEARSYLRARCPAWCDRILLSHSFKNLVNTETNQPTYDIIGYNVCVGDHKVGNLIPYR
jgi:inositol-1,4,5-trisphosphate 5-phosphatase